MGGGKKDKHRERRFEELAGAELSDVCFHPAALDPALAGCQPRRDGDFCNAEFCQSS